MGNLLKFLIIILGIYYIIKIVIRFFLPFAFNAHKRSKVNEKKEGEINIHKRPPISETPNKSRTGEYIDFEEVE